MRNGACRARCRPFHATAVDEVVDVLARPGRESVELMSPSPARGGSPLVVDVDVELRRVFLAVRAHVRQQPALRGGAQELVAARR